MRTMAAGEFKAKCLRLMDEVCDKRETIVITKKGRPVAKLSPPDPPRKAILGCLEGELEIVGDIESPVLPPKAWAALR